MPYQVAPRPESPFYHERLAQQYTAYDPAQAEAYLDRTGYLARDEEGFRLAPDGKRLSLTITVNYADMLAALEQVQGHWRAVGVEMKIEMLDRLEFNIRNEANLLDGVAWLGEGGLDVMLTPQYYLPHSYDSHYAIAWVKWYQDAEDPQAEEPPEAVRRQMALYDALRATADPARQAVLMNQILQQAADAFYVIGICRQNRGFGIVKNTFKNVPAVMPASWTYPNPAPTNPSQYFIARE